LTDISWIAIQLRTTPQQTAEIEWRISQKYNDDICISLAKAYVSILGSGSRRMSTKSIASRSGVILTDSCPSL